MWMRRAWAPCPPPLDPGFLHSGSAYLPLLRALLYSPAGIPSPIAACLIEILCSDLPVGAVEGWGGAGKTLILAVFLLLLPHVVQRIIVVTAETNTALEELALNIARAFRLGATEKEEDIPADHPFRRLFCLLRRTPLDDFERRPLEVLHPAVQAICYQPASIPHHELGLLSHFRVLLATTHQLETLLLRTRDQKCSPMGRVAVLIGEENSQSILYRLLALSCLLIRRKGKIVVIGDRQQIPAIIHAYEIWVRRARAYSLLDLLGTTLCVRLTGRHPNLFTRPQRFGQETVRMLSRLVYSGAWLEITDRKGDRVGYALHLTDPRAQTLLCTMYRIDLRYFCPRALLLREDITLATARAATTWQQYEPTGLQLDPDHFPRPRVPEFWLDAHTLPRPLHIIGAAGTRALLTGSAADFQGPVFSYDWDTRPNDPPGDDYTTAAYPLYKLDPDDVGLWMQKGRIKKVDKPKSFHLHQAPLNDPRTAPDRTLLWVDWVIPADDSKLFEGVPSRTPNPLVPIGIADTSSSTSSMR